jgi:hypothetical protein
MFWIPRTAPSNNEEALQLLMIVRLYEVWMTASSERLGSSRYKLQNERGYRSRSPRSH